MKFKQLALVIGIAALLLYSCDSNGPGPDPDPSYGYLSSKVTVDVGGMMSVTNMSKRDAYVTFSYSEARSAIPAERNHSVDKLRNGGGKLKFKDHPAATRFNANPPPYEKSVNTRSLSEVSLVYNVGDTRDFWVDKTPEELDWIQITATLVRDGTYCMIWLANGDDEEDEIDFDEMVAKFDVIYPLETNLLGFENGGGPGGDGGIDGEKKIQILVYNINKNLDTSVKSILGFFWSIDEYSQAALNTKYGVNKYRTNLAEIFYIDSESSKKYPDTIYSTLIHEFQHMINFNQKTMMRGLVSDVWYNEMLSQLAEDVIGPMVGIDTDSEGHVINERIPWFLDLYWYMSLEDWDYDYGLSYPIVYAFGAYLLRNFGGPVLMKEMLSNNKVDHDSVTSALQKINSGYSFIYALERYAEALVYSGLGPYGLPAGKCSFDKTTSSVISGETYTAKAFDIWDIECISPEDRIDLIEDDDDPWYWLNTTGPLIWPMLSYYPWAMFSHSVFLHYNDLEKGINVSCNYPWLTSFGN